MLVKAKRVYYNPLIEPLSEDDKQWNIDSGMGGSFQVQIKKCQAEKHICIVTTNSGYFDDKQRVYRIPWSELPNKIFRLEPDI